MRKWHRWITVFFGIFIFWIALTGVASQVAALMAQAEFANVPPPDPAIMEAAMAACPEGMRCFPMGPPGGEESFWRPLVGMFHHWHSGETFGPVGTTISILSGLALLFFSFSGMWMYIKMWLGRKNKSLTPKWFWK